MRRDRIKIVFDFGLGVESTQLPVDETGILSVISDDLPIPFIEWTSKCMCSGMSIRS